MNGDGFVAALVAIALANRLLLAPLPAALPTLRAVAIHAVVTALVATIAMVITASARSALTPVTQPYPLDFLALPISAVTSLIAAWLLPRWRTALRDTDWLLVGANAVALSVVGSANSASLTALVGVAFTISALFALALVVLCALEQRLQPAALPRAFRGLPITLLNAGLLALALQGLSGLLPV
ncbi:MAG: hypothetical protein JNN30_00130 [Rhodanobacteraceae bacterium]|nr:hypothetical protein [Rhodanobacteraceae bacterium]